MLATRQAAVEAFLAANEQRRHHFVQELVDRWALAPEMSSSTLAALLAASQPAELNSAGLVTLAHLSEAARTRLFPELLERRLASVFALPRATVAAGPEAVAEYTAHLQRLLGDVDVVKTLCATSPYKPAFERAFSSAAAA